MKNGFSLIELMIVVAIIGVLAALAIINAQKYVARAQVSESIVLATKFKHDINEFYSQTGVCPNLAELGMITGNLEGKYTVSLNVVDVDIGEICSIQFNLKNSDISYPLRGKYIKMIMTSYSSDIGAVQWNCKSNINQQYLPKTCQSV